MLSLPQSQMSQENVVTARLVRMGSMNARPQEREPGTLSEHSLQHLIFLRFLELVL